MTLFISQVTQNVLTIMNATGERDNGMYQCGSDNILGSRYSTAELRVLCELWFYHI